MLKLTLRTLLERKVRLIMSTLAIVLGVGFLVGVLTFNSGLNHTFNGILKGSTPAGLITAEGAASWNTSQNTEDHLLTPADMDKVSAVPEVEEVYPSVDGRNTYLLDTKGKAVVTRGAPVLAFNYTDAPNMDGDQVTLLEEGAWPQGTDEIVLDEASAERAGYSVGDTVTIIPPTADPSGEMERAFELVGTASFNGGGTAGSVLMLFSTEGAQDVYLGGKDLYTSASLTPAEGVTQAELVAAVKKVLPEGYTAQTGNEAVKEGEDAMGQSLGFINTFLIVFAVIAVIVGGFIIANTFSILVAQRVRELALLRALGASRKQVTRSVLFEALVMSLIGTTLGVLFGLGVARALAALMNTIGLEIQTNVLNLTPATVLLAYVVGILVTVLSAYVPARRAARIAPVQAMREDVAMNEGSLKRRTAIGVVMLVIGGLLALAGLVGAPGNDALWIGVGAVLWILTTALISPVLGYPVLAICRAVFGKLFGTTGRLAGENALRNPRRTGATASALMIGLSVVAAVGVLAASMSKTTDALIDKQFSTDFIVTSVNFTPFPTAVGDRIEKTDGVSQIVREQWAGAKVKKDDVFITGVTEGFSDIYRLDFAQGSSTMTGHEAILDEKSAKDYGVKPGDELTLTFPSSGDLPVKIVGVFKESDVISGIQVPMSVLTDAGIQRSDSQLSINLASGASKTAAQSAIDSATADLPIVTVQDKAQFAEGMKGQVNQLLYMIYALLALAIVIAVLGIINTLGLSVIERTREIGLLRAVGMSRSRLRRMVTLESVTISLLGALLGLGLGLVIGLLLRYALRSDIDQIGMPTVSLLVFVLVSVVFGVIAAVIPAIRASRMGVLDAISSE